MTRILILFLFFFVFIINYLDQYFYFSLFSSPHFIKISTFNNGKSFRAGIISDFQLPCFSDEKYSWQNIFISKLNRSLRILKAHRIDVLIIPGDIANCNTDYAYNIFNKVFNEVFNKRKPLLNIVMGNHDYYKNDPFDEDFLKKDESPEICQKRFQKILGEKPFSHKIINGYHFINWGSDNKNMKSGSNTNINWFKKRMEIAMRYNKTRPIFVITHLPPNNTVYGSLDWGNDILKEVFKPYSNLINFSGHSHFPIIDERSIWQKEFTAIQTGSTSYVELEKDRENGGIPKDENGSWEISGKNTMGLIMDVITDKEIKIKRINFDYEQIIAKDWIINLNLNITNSIYYEGKREKNSIAPEFDYINKIEYKKNNNNNKIRQIIFPQAKHINFVHSYKIMFINNKEIKEYFYLSDFYLMPKDRKKYYIINVPNEIKDGEYEIKIFAIESFGKISKNYLNNKILIN